MKSVSIPNQFHFVFGLKPQIEPFHLVHYLCLESCFRVNSPDKIFFHYKYLPYGKYWDLVRDRLNLVEVDLVDEVLSCKYSDAYIQRYFSYAHHSDFVRVRQLNKFGGVYADIDTIFVKKLSPPLFEQSFVMGREPPVLDLSTNREAPSVCNAFLMGRKNSEFGAIYLQQMSETFDGTWSKHSCTLADRLSELHPDKIHIEPQRSFYKFPWTKEGIEAMLLESESNLEGVYSLHLWAHLWWSRSRRDFTNFHSGLLTERYIRSVDSTYNLIARPYLPKTRGKSWFFRARQLVKQDPTETTQNG